WSSETFSSWISAPPSVKRKPEPVSGRLFLKRTTPGPCYSVTIRPTPGGPFHACSNECGLFSPLSDNPRRRRPGHRAAIADVAGRDDAQGRRYRGGCGQPNPLLPRPDGERRDPAKADRPDPPAGRREFSEARTGHSRPHRRGPAGDPLFAPGPANVRP